MKPGDVFWIDFPPATGYEQAGRRPAIVLQDEAFAGNLPLVIVVPLTGAVAAARFAGTLTIEPDESNKLRRTSNALVFQIRAIDRRTVEGQIGSVTPTQLNTIYDLLDKMTGRGGRLETDE